MFSIVFYRDRRGREPVKEYLETLHSNGEKNKDHRTKLKKIYEYLGILSSLGTCSGMPYVKHIKENLWELRPSSDRVFFFCWDGHSFVLLHHFTKKSQKTPRKEIEQAERNMRDFLERSAAR